MDLAAWSSACRRCGCSGGLSLEGRKLLLGLLAQVCQACSGGSSSSLPLTWTSTPGMAAGIVPCSGSGGVAVWPPCSALRDAHTRSSLAGADAWRCCWRASLQHTSTGGSVGWWVGLVTFSKGCVRSSTLQEYWQRRLGAAVKSTSKAVQHPNVQKFYLPPCCTASGRSEPLPEHPGPPSANSRCSLWVTLSSPCIVLLGHRTCT